MNKYILAICGLVIAVIAGVAVWRTTAPASEQIAGSLSGPDISSRYLQWGGVTEWNTGAQLAATSSVVCSIQAPVGTSTILGASLRVDTTGLGTQVFDLSTSTSPYASSSPALIAAAPVPGASGDVAAWMPGYATSSVAVLGNNPSGSTNGKTPFIIKPGEFLNFRIATGTPGVFASYLTGKCTARFQQL